MKPAIAFARLIPLQLLLGGSWSAAATLDFEPPPPAGTQYGQAFGQAPGQNIPELGQDGINLSFENFVDTSFEPDFTGFVAAQIGGRFASAFPTTPLSMDSINARFDFAGLGFNVNQASIEYIEFGILYNFAVNDGSVHEVGALTELPSKVAPGIDLTIEELDAGTGRMRLTLVGDVSSFLIGGYELGIDNITAIPEPATLLLLGICGAFIVWRGSRRFARPAQSAR